MPDNSADTEGFQKFEDKVEQIPEPVASEPASEQPGVERLKAFEDKVLGEDVPRHGRGPELGHGSKFSQLPASAKAHHAALHQLIEAEKVFAAAEQNLAAANAALDDAKAKADATGAAVVEEI